MNARALLASALLLVALPLGACGGSDESGTSSTLFAPEATLKAVGPHARTDKPDFVLRVEAKKGDANMRSVQVELPPVTLVDAEAIGSICSRAELESDRCVDHRPIGVARVVSPAYEKPLSGDVYTVSGGGRLPKLVYVLGGPADILLEGEIVSEGGRIGAGVDDIPDTPLDSFEFTVEGGKSGYLVVSRDLCAGDPQADATFESQDGQVLREKIPLEAGC